MRATLMLLGIVLAAGPQSAIAETTIDYKKQIEPIFEARCFGCHGAAKGSAKIRLHTPEAIAESIKAHDDLLAAGKPDDSELYARLVLPADNPRRMPQGGDPLTAEQTALIKKWIEEGAVYVTVDAPPQEEAAEPELPKRPAIEAADPQAIAKVEATGALVLPIYATSNELRVSFPSTKDSVTDETVASLVAVASQIVELDLSGTAVTDACAESLGQLVHLDTLHLEKTAISDAIAPTLAKMQFLNYLNLHSTKITDQTLTAVNSIPSLQKLYVWQTAVTFDAAKKMEQAKPGLEINLGWNHPGVVRERLGAELARVEKKAAESAAAIKEAEQALKAAQAENTTATQRVEAIKKELEALKK